MKLRIFIGFGLLLGLGLVVLVGVIWLFGNYVISPSKIEHILLISIDTCRADHLGCYGYRRKTSPNIDAIAAEGITFAHAVAPVPITLPSHSSMLTGTIPLYHRVRDNSSYRLASANVTLAEILRENGFSTGAVVGAFVLDSQFGLDQGFETYNDRIQIDEDRKLFSFNEREAEEVTQCANAWLEKHSDENFFLFVHYFDPHAAYKPHRGFVFTSDFGLASPTDLYDSEIAYVDHCIGQLVGKLKELNLYDSTLLIVTSDHGEGFGEHAENAHGFFIYHSTLRVPLVVKLPGRPRGKTIGDIVGLIDILPTVCGCLGISVPTHVQGKDLSTFFRRWRERVGQRYLFCESLMPTKYELGPLFGLVSERWKYIHTSEPELYDLKQDPHETKNLLHQQPQQTQIMQDQLNLILHDNSLYATADNKVEPDEETIERLQSLGYVSSRSVDESIQVGRGGLNPKDFIEVHNFMASFLTLASSKKFDEAKKLANDMLAKRPNMKRAHFYLGLVALYEEDKQAMRTHFSRYLQLAEPDSDSNSDMVVKSARDLAVAYTSLGDMFRDEGQTEQAIAHYKKALSHKPYLLKANYNLASVYVREGNLSGAVACYTRVLNVYADATGALNDLAWILATTEHRNIRIPADAVKFALRACELTEYDNPNYLDSLAAAYAAVGRFPEAVETAQKAISLAESANQPHLAEEIKGRLEFYKNGRAYRDSAK